MTTTYLRCRDGKVFIETGTWNPDIHFYDVHSAVEVTFCRIKKTYIPLPMTTPNTTEPAAGNSGSHNTHARLAPSDSKRWVNCTASIEATKDFPKDDSVFASTGTEAHDWAEKVLTGKVTLEEVPDDFRPAITIYVNHCNSLTPEGVTPYVEVEVPLFYDEKSTGTCDFAVVTDDLVVLEDYKNGAGVLVRAFENDQLAIYGLSLINYLQAMYDFHPATEVRIGICQPNHREWDASPWVLTLHDLREYCRDIEYSAIQIQTGRGLKFAPGEDTCRWCPKAWKVQCPARNKWITEAFNLPDVPAIDFLSALPELDKVEAKLPVEERITIRHAAASGEPDGRLTDEQALAMWKASKGIRGFLDDIDEWISDRASSGDTFNGAVKLVMGREGNRAWANEEAADKYLKNKLTQGERYKMSLKSPTQIADLLKTEIESSTRMKNTFESLITRSPAKPVAVPIEDKHPAVTSALDSLPALGSLPALELNPDDI